MSILDDSFKEIKLINKVESPDELGGFSVSYKSNKTFEGLIARTSSSERSIASQNTIEESFTLMTKDISITINPGDIVRGFGKTCIVTSYELKSPISSPTMKDIRQWDCKSYNIPNGEVIE